MRFLILCLAAIIAGLASADSGLYGGKSPVVSVNAKNYNSLIAQSNHTSILEFYAPWCGHCQNLKPAYEKAAKHLTGLAKVAAINCDEDANKAFCGQFGVQGFPTLKIVRPGKKAGKPVVEDYQGPREAKAIIDAVSDKITNHVKRLKADGLDEWLGTGARSKALLFTEKGTTAPLVKALAIDFLGSIDFAQIRNKETAAVEKFEVSKFPTLVVQQNGRTSKYDGQISRDNLVQFLSEFATPNADPAPKKAKIKATSTKPTAEKSSAASSAFSKASAKHKSSDFEDYMEHSGTVVQENDVPTGSPLPNVEQKQKPMVVPDVAPPLPTIESASDLDELCLKPTSKHCVLILLPENPDAGRSDKVNSAVSAFASVEDKYKKRKAPIFPAYVVPASNTAAVRVREALELGSQVEVEVIVLNMKKGWSRRYNGKNFDTIAIESFMDDVRFGDGPKQRVAKDTFAGRLATSADDVAPPLAEPPSSPDPTHDEL